ncbi:UDP-glucose/GDP-mannose dehydrogenase family protein [Nocardia sp. 2]|uniref:UDP-glucose 6-dehydrogenase n=1 Tax=Nocardia acididurans TaxID=2802282 RepID=A0ABS1MHW4_9NOCA|nr:UDP-glucose/GDP-mannose dehydrogenase family protein [Nocardia acididurans]MBL1080247.1 UDP-glucose/GDP-mannose dehydrogenase family protein [Nocardia acididurans]
MLNPLPHNPSQHALEQARPPGDADIWWRVAVIGCGYVGLTSAVCLAALGHAVIAVDTNTEVITGLRSGLSPIPDEPGLSSLLAVALARGTVDFTTTALPAVEHAAVVLVCVPTPALADGAADLSAVFAVVEQIGPHLAAGAVLVLKSTVPVGTCRAIERRLGRPDVAVVSNPEFLREGYAVNDCMNPSRIVIGAHDAVAAKTLASLFDWSHGPVVHTTPETAELAKLAANAMLAVRLSYVNTLAALGERLGADVPAVLRVLGLDPRIGPDYLRPGPGWGGPCLPKDATALLHQATSAGVDFGVLAATVVANDALPQWICQRVREAAGGSLTGVRVALLGLTFKSGSSDTRCSPALRVAAELVAAGAVVTGYDPTVHPGRGVFLAGVAVCDSVLAAVTGACVVVLTTDWPQCVEPGWAQIAAAMTTRAAVIDTCHVLDPARLAEYGLTVMFDSNHADTEGNSQS